MLEIEKFLMDFTFGDISSLGILAFNMQVPYTNKNVSYPNQFLKKYIFKNFFRLLNIFLEHGIVATTLGFQFDV